MSLLSYCRYYPAGIVQTQQPVFVWLYCLRLQIAGWASRVFRLRGHLCVYFRYGLITCSSPFMVTLLIGFRDLVTLLPAIQATGLLASTLTGLSPVEHTSLSWTHNLVQNFATRPSKDLYPGFKYRHIIIDSLFHNLFSSQRTGPKISFGSFPRFHFYMNNIQYREQNWP